MSNQQTPRNYLAECAALDVRAFGYYETLRKLVADAARDGRATYLPAGARDNRTARVLIDGIEVGQASTCVHLVDVAGVGSTFGERPLVAR